MQHRRPAAPPRSPLARASLVCAAALLLAACGGDGGGGTEPPPPPQRTASSLRVSASTLQVDDADTASLAVTVLDQNGQAFASVPGGVSLSWSSDDAAVAGVAGSGAAGRVSGNRPGQTWVRVRSGSMADSARVTVRQVAAALRTAAGDGQSGTAGDPLPEELVARVVDRHGDGVPGVSVAFAVESGGGTVSPASATTDASGEARATWVLGTAAGENRARASAAGLTGSPAEFTAVGAAGAAAAMAAVDGDAQSAPVGTALPQPVRVRVRDGHGNAVQGATVTFRARTGSGSASPATATTDAQGVASATWTLGSAAGTHTLDATGAGATVSFSATARAGTASALVRTGGDGQTGTVGQALGTPLSVRVEDAMGNPVSGVTVAFRATSGGGSLAPASATTDAGGVARATWTLGTTAGTQRAEAAAAGKTVAFSATARAGAAASVAVSPATASVREGETVQLSAAVADAHGNPLPGAAVSWTTSASSVATVGSAGKVTGVAAGAATITATSGSAKGTARVDVLERVDTRAPTLTGFTFSPASVDVSSSAKTVDVRLTAADAGSGVAAWSVTLRGPGGSTSIVTRSCTRVSGTAASGTWSCQLTVPRAAGAGTWAFSEVFVEDAAGNAATYSEAALKAASYATTLQVASGGADTAAPSVTGLTLTPTAVDVTGGARTVTARASVSDAGSGVAYVQVSLWSPTRQANPATGQVESCSTTSGTSGAWSCTLTVPQGAEGGTWTARVLAVDALGNARTYTSADLALPTLAVTSGGVDAAAPALTAFSFAPGTVDVGGGSASVAVTVGASDAVAGVENVTVSFVSPGRSPYEQKQVSCVITAPSGGTRAAGTWTCTLTVPAYGEPGSWTVQAVVLTDRVGNRRSLDAAGVRAAVPGAATVLTVTN